MLTKAAEKRQPYFVDLETCGLYGIAVTIQWSVGDGPVTIHEVWKRPIRETIKLILDIANHKDGVVIFNAAFDWFHLVKLINCLLLCDNHDEPPNAFEVADVELKARDGFCLKPVSILDLFLYARKTEYQSTMERDDISIRRVPAEIAHDLAAELEKRVRLNDIYFARRKEQGPQWAVTNSTDYETKKPLKGLQDVVLRFAPSSGLKALAADALGLDKADVLKYGDIEVPDEFRPTEVGWFPFASRNQDGELEPGTWPFMVKFHIVHWEVNAKAREYAVNDIVYMRELYKSFGEPEFDDDDSVLACSVAATRFKGFAIDLDKIRDLREKALKAVGTVPTAPQQVLHWITEPMNPIEKELVNETTKETLAEICKWRQLPDGYVCDKPELHTEHTANSTCIELHDALSVPHPAASRAKMVVNARSALKEIELYDKLIAAGRFHPSFKVIGTLSGRMAGADGLNPQGIKHSFSVRSAFTLAFPGEFLDGGDFKSFEVVLAVAEYGDENLSRDLQSGKKIHALFGTKLYPEMSYDDILASEGKEGDADKYFPSKSGVFSMIYGGDHNTLHRKQGISLSRAETAYTGFMSDYPKIAESRKKVFDSFCSMFQTAPGGPVVWRDPADYVESMFGFRRYFTLENTLAKALFTLAEKPLAKWKNIQIKVKRRDKLQTAAGATRSALYGAAFGVQAANMRAAANHKIQSAGAQITKRMQRRIWDIQPSGLSEWLVRPINIHDEVITTVANAEISRRVREAVDEVVNVFKPRVPLLAIDWKVNMSSWAGKK